MVSASEYKTTTSQLHPEAGDALARIARGGSFASSILRRRWRIMRHRLRVQRSLLSGEGGRAAVQWRQRGVWCSAWT